MGGRISTPLSPSQDLESVRERSLVLGIDPPVLSATACKAILFDPVSHPYLNIPVEWRAKDGFPFVHGTAECVIS
jgi:hypothetical protein